MRQVQVENLDRIPLLGISEAEPLSGANRVLKRALDIGLVIVGLPVLVPLFAIVALLIKLEDGGSIFYRTERVGENGRRFQMLKFRSMIPNADQLRQQIIAEAGEDPRHPKVADDPRITRVGKFIRRTSLDELPNFINVVRGEMSIVGPRPALPDEVELYENWHRQRLQTIPGITGLWQVSGRSEVPFDEMCLMDIYYIENWSIRFDLQIMLMTVPRVLLRSGAY
jgi:exopolysaccharide biosynthesis polyprenyl glycosylphosphotransferase